MSLVIIRYIIAAVIVSYIIWLFNTRFMGKSLALSKVLSWVLLATFLIFLVLTGLSYLVEGA